MRFRHHLWWFFKHFQPACRTRTSAYWNIDQWLSKHCHKHWPNNKKRKMESKKITKKTIDKKTTQITNFLSCCSSAIYQPLLKCLWLSSIVSYQFTKLRSIREWHRGKTTRTPKTTCKTLTERQWEKSTKDKIYKDKWQRNNWQKDKITNLQN